ncbi:MAG TPA: GNAT family protein [Solirubrobacteraceae bacterium]|jgi:RimJ/RimL family protein N-acetyltransferase|nr:GNAT family protein [Solirubrobacteraceae bacterium]
MPAIPEPGEPLSDGHVSLRLAAERDIPEVLIAHQEDPGLAAALGLERAPSGAQLGRAMEEAQERREAGAGVTLTILEPGSDDCRGQIEADRFDWEHAHANLAVWLVPDARGRRLAPRALALAAEWLIEAAGLVRVQLMAPPENEAVIRAALGAGFTREGVLRAHARAGGGRVDLAVLSRIASDASGR